MRLGDLAIAYELISEEQLERCLELQETQSPPRYLGEVLVAEGLVNQQTLGRLLSAQRKEAARHEGTASVKRTEIAKSLASASLRDYLSALARVDGQELHLAAGARPTARVHGTFLTLRPEPMTPEEAERVLSEVFDDASRACFAERDSVSVVHADEGFGRYRASLFQDRNGMAGILCRVPTELPSIKDLGLPPIVHEVTQLRTGLVLVAGPSASGKSTTLAAMIETLNAQRRCHVVCLDDAVEFLHESKHSLVTQVEVGTHVADWDMALFAALRLDPDVLVAGDLLTPGRLSIALRAAETGHLVLGTLPTGRAAHTLTAVIRGCGVERRNQVCSSLADLLRFVVCQHLIPDPEGSRMHLAYEVMRNTPAISNMIREQRFHQLDNVIQTSKPHGMITLDESLFGLVRDGKVSAGDAVARATDPDTLLGRLEAVKGRKA